MDWDKDGRRKGLPASRCKLCMTTISHGKTYCHGYANFGAPKLHELCKDCMFHIRNIKD